MMARQMWNDNDKDEQNDFELMRNIVRHLAKLSQEEQEKAYKELKRDFPEARNKELRRDQFDKILREEKERIIEANTIDLTKDDNNKQRKMTDFLKKVPFT